MEIEVLHRDAHIVVVDKPEGVLVHHHQMDHHSPNVVAILSRRFGQPIYPVHRLDRMTSGVMVLALNSEGAADLSDQFRHRSTVKNYLAIVRGHTEARGVVENPVPRSVGGPPVAARTEYKKFSDGMVPEPVGRYKEAWFSLVTLRLMSGRAHQARRHLHQINHPVLGDNRHGDKTYNRWAAARLGAHHMYLRAIRLEFDHPATGRRTTATVGLPEYWRRACSELNLTIPEALSITKIRDTLSKLHLVELADTITQHNGGRTGNL